MGIPIWANRLIAEPALFNNLLEDVEKWLKKDTNKLRGFVRSGKLNEALLCEGRLDGLETLSRKLKMYDREEKENGNLE